MIIKMAHLKCHNEKMVYVIKIEIAWLKSDSYVYTVDPAALYRELKNVKHFEGNDIFGRL